MGALIEINTDGLAKLADTVGGWLGLNALATILNAKAEGVSAECKAKADIKSKIIRQQGEDKLADYILAREKRKLNNVQNVIEQAQQHLVEEEQVSDEPVNSDWINRFFTIVEDVSDVEMSQLWARILAGEVKQPKSYSLRTLEILRNMTKDDADLFVKATTYMLGCDSIINEKDVSLSVEEQLILTDIGLVNNESLTVTYTIETADNPSFIQVDNYYGIGIYNPDRPTMRIGFKVRSLTVAGKELIKLIDRKTLDVVVQCVVGKCEAAKCKAVIKIPIKGYTPSGRCLYSKKGELLYKRGDD